jgi:hypothetical protein
MELTIYSDDFDESENVAGNGMSGHAFLEENGRGECFGKANKALAYVARLGLAVDTLTYCYRLPSTGEQMFRKFKLTPLADGRH